MTSNAQPKPSKCASSEHYKALRHSTGNTSFTHSILLSTIISTSCVYFFLTPNSRSVYCAGVSLNIHSYRRLKCVACVVTKKKITRTVEMQWCNFRQCCYETQRIHLRCFKNNATIRPASTSLASAQKLYTPCQPARINVVWKQSQRNSPQSDHGDQKDMSIVITCRAAYTTTVHVVSGYTRSFSTRQQAKTNLIVRQLDCDLNEWSLLRWSLSKEKKRERRSFGGNFNDFFCSTIQRWCLSTVWRCFSCWAL